MEPGPPPRRFPPPSPPEDRQTRSLPERLYDPPKSGGATNRPSPGEEGAAKLLCDAAKTPLARGWRRQGERGSVTRAATGTHPTPFPPPPSPLPFTAATRSLRRRTSD